MRSHRFPAIPRRTGLVALFTVAVVLLTTALPLARPTLAQDDPPPEEEVIASFGYSPSDPFVFSIISFFVNVYDPLFANIAGCSWDFGDGTSEPLECYPIHTYAAVGSYNVRLTVTMDDGRSGTAVTTIPVVEAPPPEVMINGFPSDPSIYDEVTLYAYIWDQTNQGIASCAWDLGDGTTINNCDWLKHRYAADGDYPIHLVVTTNDGRIGEAATTIRVRTHDVGITKLSVPQSARAGQTRTISVGLTNKRADEYVRVTLYKSRPDGSFIGVGTSIQLVAGRSGNRVTSFDFNYTFTPDDALVGKVIFRVEADVIDASNNWLRDAFPADNQVTALPTKVNAR